MEGMAFLEGNGEIKIIYIQCLVKMTMRQIYAMQKCFNRFKDFPGSTAAKTTQSQFRGPGLDPWSGD